ncbi:Mu transposase C-terminal domain-containing protein [Nocardia sp. NPDC059239]|uniref:Mu transposase C-terminal domain-containing protein n=1 Tax=unclassified Nocardia TaxID=2637762 RepID=UPI00368996B2
MTAVGLTELTDADRRQAMRRYEILRPHLDDGVPLTRSAAHAGVPLRTAQRWLHRYRDAGLAGLAPSRRRSTRWRTHSEIGTTPQQSWIADGWLPRMPEDLEHLDLLLVQVATPRIVHRDGIHFQGLRYLHPTLAAYVREPVTARYDPRDITEIRVFHRDRFLCKAVSPDHAGDTIGLEDIQAARRAFRRRVRDQINERITVVTDYLPAPERVPKLAKSSAVPPLRAYLED